MVALREPPDLGAVESVNAASVCGGERLGPETHPEHGDTGGIGATEEVELGVDPRRNRRRVDE